MIKNQQTIKEERKKIIEMIDDSWEFEKGFVPVYSTTRREAVEEQQSDGAVRLVHNFKHQSFRKYGV